MKKDLTYKEAAARLEEIVRYIEQDSPDVDELTTLVAEIGRASCRERV